MKNFFSFSVITLLIIAFLVVFLWHKIFVTIHAGEAGILFERFTGTVVDKIYSEGEESSKLTISLVSFGFKHGIPSDCDLVFDVRFLPNPYYAEELRPKTGDDEEVRSYVMNSKISEEFYEKLSDMVQFLVPQYIEEGKQHLVIGIGCTGGRHRSVTISNLIYNELVNKGYRVVKKHRDSMLR